MEDHEKYMLRALELAEMGRGNVAPNPMVGCVIVYEDKIIGEGYHAKYGEEHAEVNAIDSVKNQKLLSNATAYVTLEPCAHFGKTPPCANLLVEKNIKKVVIAAVDSNPLVGGKGVSILKEAGIEVLTGVLEKQARIQNRRFFTVMEKGRPYILLKWAETKDGYVARKDYSSKWISNSSSRQLVHKWRAEEQAILVGKNTAKYDDPSLTTRDWLGKNPIRLVMDSNLELSSKLKLFDGSGLTIVYNLLQSKKEGLVEWVKLEQMHLEELLQDLQQRKIQSVLVEGGTTLLRKFLNRELWDEARVFTGNTKFGEGIGAPFISKSPVERINLLDDELNIYFHV